LRQLKEYLFITTKVQDAEKFSKWDKDIPHGKLRKLLDGNELYHNPLHGNEWNVLKETYSLIEETMDISSQEIPNIRTDILIRTLISKHVVAKIYSFEIIAAMKQLQVKILTPNYINLSKYPINDKKIVITIFKNIAIALYELHTKYRICHGNLTEENILIGPNLDIHLRGFKPNPGKTSDKREDIKCFVNIFKQKMKKEYWFLSKFCSYKRINARQVADIFVILEKELKSIKGDVLQYLRSIKNKKITGRAEVVDAELKTPEKEPEKSSKKQAITKNKNNPYSKRQHDMHKNSKLVHKLLQENFKMQVSLKG